MILLEDPMNIIFSMGEKDLTWNFSEIDRLYGWQRLSPRDQTNIIASIGDKDLTWGSNDVIAFMGNLLLNL